MKRSTLAAPVSPTIDAPIRLRPATVEMTIDGIPAPVETLGGALLVTSIGTARRAIEASVDRVAPAIQMALHAIAAIRALDTGSIAGRILGQRRSARKAERQQARRYEKSLLHCLSPVRHEHETEQRGTALRVDGLFDITA